jgi:hypothetical protein
MEGRQEVEKFGRGERDKELVSYCGGMERDGVLDVQALFLLETVRSISSGGGEVDGEEVEVKFWGGQISRKLMSQLTSLSTPTLSAHSPVTNDIPNEVSSSSSN